VVRFAPAVVAGHRTFLSGHATLQAGQPSTSPVLWLDRPRPASRLTVDQWIHGQSLVVSLRSPSDLPTRLLLPSTFYIVTPRLNRFSPTDRWFRAPSSPAHNLI